MPATPTGRRPSSTAGSHVAVLGGRDLRRRPPAPPTGLADSATCSHRAAHPAHRRRRRRRRAGAGPSPATPPPRSRRRAGCQEGPRADTWNTGDLPGHAEGRLGRRPATARRPASSRTRPLARVGAVLGQRHRPGQGHHGRRSVTLDGRTRRRRVGACEAGEFEATPKTTSNSLLPDSRPDSVLPRRPSSSRCGHGSHTSDDRGNVRGVEAEGLSGTRLGREQDRGLTRFAGRHRPATPPSSRHRRRRRRRRRAELLDSVRPTMSCRGVLSPS